MKNLKIVHLSDNDISGGSAFYANRIHNFLKDYKNIKSEMHVLYKKSNDESIIKFKFKENLNIWKNFYFFFLSKRNKYSFYNYGKYVINNILQVSNILKNDTNAIIIYNNSNFISPNIFNFFHKKNISIFLYLTDMEMITGGCHYNFECNNYQNSCYNCPAFKFLFKRMAEKNLSEKKLSFYNINLTFLVPNTQIRKNLENSAIFNKVKHKIIDFKLSLDLNKYSPEENEKKSKRIFSFRSSLNPRKGQGYLLKSLDYLKRIRPDFIKLIHFNILGDSSIIDFLNEKKISFKFFEKVNNEKKLINFYRQSDFFINQSVQDVGPTMVPEALSCGIPIISFNNGMAADLIENDLNGYLVKNRSSEDLAHAINQCINLDEKKLKLLKSQSRTTALNHLDLSKAIKNVIDQIN